MNHSMRLVFAGREEGRAEELFIGYHVLVLG
jgi:hypothetical protein